MYLDDDEIVGGEAAQQNPASVSEPKSEEPVEDQGEQGDVPRHFLINYTDPGDVLVHALAIGELYETPEVGSQIVFVKDKADLRSLDKSALVTIYNRIRRGPALKDFHDKSKGVDRVWTMLENYDPDFVNKADESASNKDTVVRTKKAKATSSKPKAKKAKAPKVKKAKVAKTKTPSEKKPRKPRKPNDRPRGEKTKDIIRLCKRKNGATRKEVLEAIGWPTISFQAVAKSLGFKCRTAKVPGKPTSYFFEEK